MTVSGVWHDIGAGENFFTKLLRLIILTLAASAFYFLAVLPLAWPQQAVMGLLILLMALVLARSTDSYLVTLALIALSVFCTVRYGYWRVTGAWRFFQDPSNHWGALDAFFILCLLSAEVYAFVTLFLGYFQTIWPLRRAPVALPDDTEAWPHIDVLISTYDEPLDVVRYTALGALNMDWPADKLHVYILDDGWRKEFEEFAFEAGVGYKTRPDNKYAKAGNINSALKTVTSPYVAVFDADHVPTRSFLQMTMGWMLRDSNLAILQTPHHFYSPDPFERNLSQFRIIPNEDELFYGIVQDGNDFWNASFFCGTCAVLRREALDDIGGIATETVTEDAHTSLRMQMKGWNSAYINIPQAAGLATERLSAHIRQRIRWARGMVQILRTDNPLFAPGLTIAQRLCYFNAMGHFLYAVPRLIFLTAPLIFLLLDHTNIPGYWAAILAYAMPHLALSNVANSRIQGQYRHSFWNEIYETVLSPYILLPTLMALINPGLGKFNVTAKGGVVKSTFFDSRIAQPFLILLFFNIAGLVIAIPRYLIWDRDRHGTILMNVAWCIFNIVILGVCIAVAREIRQLRTAVRVSVVTPVAAKMPGGRTLQGETMDLSSGGTGIRFEEEVKLLPKTEIKLTFALPSVVAELPAVVISSEGSVLRVRFDNLSIAAQEALTMVLYSRADSWLGWDESRESDNALQSLGNILQISIRGLASAFTSFFTEKRPGKTSTLKIAGTSGILLLAAALFASPQRVAAQQVAAPSVAPSAAQKIGGQNIANSNPTAADNTPVLPGKYRDTFTLADAGAQQIEMHGIAGEHNIYFALPQTHVVRGAKIHIHYAFSPSLLPQLSHLKLSMNGTLFATVEPTVGQSGRTDSKWAEATFDIPPQLLVRSNTLTIEFIGHSTYDCEDPANTALWARIDRDTSLEISGDLLPLADDLKQLPMPFLDSVVAQPLSIPLVFASAPSYKAIQAAGVVASYFGMVSENRAVRFPVHIGDIPQGNVVVISDSSSNLPPELDLPNISAPTVVMRTNPNDQYGKVLVLAGATPDQLLVAAQAIALHSDMLAGAQAPIESLKLPGPLQPDESPRWARTDHRVELGNYASAENLQGDGSAPLNVYFRIPPDIFVPPDIFNSGQSNAVLRLDYRYNSVPIGPISSLQVKINDAFLGSIPLIPGQEASKDMKADVSVPVFNLRPFSNTLSFDFAFQLLKKSSCEETTPTNLLGAIMRDTSLDLRGYPHYAQMPNLEIFANAGFPFTRMADLSETTVVLPPVPTGQEIETFITMMGHFGRQTGYPVFRVSVAGPDSLHSGANTDFMIIGVDDDQPAFEMLKNDLPVALGGGQIQVRDTHSFFLQFQRAWWKLNSSEQTESGELTAGGTPDAVIEEIESPYDAGRSRSIVAIHLRDADAFEPFIATFLNVQQAHDINGSVSALLGANFRSFRLGSEVYHVGELPRWTRLTLWFLEVPYRAVVAAAIVFILAILIAIWIRQWLRAKARARLRAVRD